ncbi:MAG: hypothetical protein J5757_00450 [Lachnospiraceae bacterium]|nr:hypothetical protein [Lachnospiraceae bacterium]
MGWGFKGNASHYHKISENTEALKNEYPFSDGYFGEKGDSKSNPHVRHIASDDPAKTAKAFYDSATYGGLESPLFDKNGNIIGQKTSMADGSVISWRSASHSDGSPAVDINIERSTDSGGIKQQKIHFVKEGGYETD